MVCNKDVKSNLAEQQVEGQIKDQMPKYRKCRSYSRPQHLCLIAGDF